MGEYGNPPSSADASVQGHNIKFYPLSRPKDGSICFFSGGREMAADYGGRSRTQ